MLWRRHTNDSGAVGYVARCGVGTDRLLVTTTPHEDAWTLYRVSVRYRRPTVTPLGKVAAPTIDQVLLWCERQARRGSSGAVAA